MVTVGEFAKWNLPKASDPDGDEFTVDVEIDKLPWLTSDSKSFTFNGDKAKAESAGQYKVPITLKDQYGASVTVKQIVIVEFIETQEKAATNEGNSTDTDKVQESEASSNSTSKDDSSGSENQG